MAFHDTKKNNGYHSLFKNYLNMFRGAVFSGHGVYILTLVICNLSVVYTVSILLK